MTTASAIDEDAEFLRVYGPWQPLTPVQVQSLMDGIEHPWWLVGGYAIEAFTGVEREHEDIDIGLFTEHVPALRRQLEPRFHLWSNFGGTFRFFDDKNPDPIHPVSQIWVREHSQDPWVMDRQLTPSVDGKWQSKRDLAHIADFDEVTWIDSPGDPLPEP